MKVLNTLNIIVFLKLKKKNVESKLRSKGQSWGRLDQLWWILFDETIVSFGS